MEWSKFKAIETSEIESLWGLGGYFKTGRSSGVKFPLISEIELYKWF